MWVPITQYQTNIEDLEKAVKVLKSKFNLALKAQRRKR
jgi:hypothetical protein